MKVSIVLILVLALVSAWIIVSLVSELRFAKRFSARMAERWDKGSIVYGEAGEAGTENVTELQALYSSTLRAWCVGDGEAYGAAFTDDAEYIAFTGEVTRGRQVIAKAHQELFDTWLKGSCLVGVIESIRFLSSDTAALVALGGTTFDGSKTLRRPSIQTYLARKVNGRWLFTNFQNSRVSDGNVLELMVLGVRTSLLRM